MNVCEGRSRGHVKSIEHRVDMTSEQPPRMPKVPLHGPSNSGKGEVSHPKVSCTPRMHCLSPSPLGDGEAMEGRKRMRQRTMQRVRDEYLHRTTNRMEAEFTIIYFHQQLHVKVSKRPSSHSRGLVLGTSPSHWPSAPFLSKKNWNLMASAPPQHYHHHHHPLFSSPFILLHFFSPHLLLSACCPSHAFFFARQYLRLHRLQAALQLRCSRHRPSPHLHNLS